MREKRDFELVVGFTYIFLFSCLFRIIVCKNIFLFRKQLKSTLSFDTGRVRVPLSRR